VGAYRIRKDFRQSTLPRYSGVLGLILFSVGASTFLGFFLIALDTRPDLSDGHPRAAGMDEAAIPLGWPSLRVSGMPDALPTNGAMVKMLGYMMDGYRFAARGSDVGMFVLMPSAGNFLHPAHREPEEMVEVWLKTGTVFFQERELVWASGKFERTRGPVEDHALYALRQASVAPASQGDISRWFAP
jgi:hypothetical protein